MNAQDILSGMAKPSATGWIVERARLRDVCLRLQDAGYRHLCLITGIDWKKSWEVVYHLVKHDDPVPLVLRVTLPRHDPTIPSLTPLWQAADWHERETFDLLGIRFTGHPDLRRILLPADFTTHPLRKEFSHGNRS